MNQFHLLETSRRAAKLLIAMAAVAAMAFPAAAGADGITTPHAAPAPTLTAPKAAPTAPAVGAPSGSGGPSTAAPTGVSATEPNGNPGGQASPMPESNQNQKPFSGDDQLREFWRQAIDEDAAALFFDVPPSYQEAVSSNYLPEEPDPSAPQSLFGILPIDLGGPLYNFLQITEQVENGDHNGAAF